MVFCNVANAELLSKHNNETRPDDFFSLSFLLWSCNPTSLSPLPLVLHFPHLCCLGLLRCLYRLSTTFDYSVRRANLDVFCYNKRHFLLAMLTRKKNKNKNKRNKNILPTRTLFLWQNTAACSTWEVCFKNSFSWSGHFTYVTASLRPESFGNIVSTTI